MADPLLPPRKVADSRSEMTELILPNDANTLGNLLGGRLMHYIDLVGAMAAYRHARAYVVTASMDHIDFIAPVHVGDLLILKSTLNRAFRTSMEVGVKVWVEHTITVPCVMLRRRILPLSRSTRRDGRVRVPPLEPETEEDKRRYHDAGRRREQGELERERKKSARQSLAAAGHKLQSRFLKEVHIWHTCKRRQGRKPSPAYRISSPSVPAKAEWAKPRSP
jgi:acyl-CoA hydrolase